MGRYLAYLFSDEFEEQRFAYGCLAPAAFVIFAFQVIPLVYSLYIATSRYTLGTRSQFVGLYNFLKFFTADTGLTVLKNTLIFMFVSVTISFVLGFALALLINRKFHGQRLVRTLLLTPIMISPVVSGSAWKFIFNDQYGFINQVLRSFGIQGHNWLSDPHLSLWIIVFVGIWMYIPWFTIILYAGLQALPISLFEAADIDGASRWQKLKWITVPLLLPVIMVSVIIQTLNGLMVFDIVYVITFGGYFFHLGYGTSIAVITAAIGLIIGIVMFRYLNRKIARFGIS
jgi:multiple sugar transport system permease protein